jgi:release factor glutamine methyltransferase
MTDDTLSAVPDTIGGLYQHIRGLLAGAGADNPAFEARLIIEKRTGLDQAVLISEPGRLVPVAQKSRILQDVERLTRGEPLHRIYGEREFWGLTFAIGPETLEPRPDTETLVQAALNLFGANPPSTILDLGTGSGCILLSLLKEWPSCEGLGVDLSYETVKVAQANARALGLADRARFICGSWAEAVDARFDLIVSNPPYIARDVIPTLERCVREHDPILALDGGEDGLDAYRQIFFSLERHLLPGGRALFEIGFDQGESIVRLAEKYRCSARCVYRDLAGRARVVEISCGDK